MSPENNSIREKIILAVIEGIEEHGIQSVTVREIAQRAKVNVAAINYHFGSKDNLLDIALHQTLDEAFVNMINEELEVPGRSKAESLQAFFTALLAGMRQYPGLTRAHIYAPLLENDYRGVFASRFSQFLSDLHRQCKNLFPEMTDQHLQLTLIEMLSAVMFPGLLSGLFSEYSGIDFDDSADQARYIKHLVYRYFPLSDEDQV